VTDGAASLNTSRARGWRISLDEVRDPSELEGRWLELESRAQGSFFQSWGWVGTWLRTFPSRARPILIQAELDGRVVGLSVLGQNRVKHLRFLTSKALLVSETGIPADDALTVEHSGLLMERGLEPEIIGQCLAALGQTSFDWDEIYVSGVERGHLEAYVQGAALADLTPVVRADHPYFFVDLAALSSGDKGYLDTLSRNTRYQIRRAFREYELRGSVSYKVADSCAEALDYFARLRELHQAYWEHRGFPGAFATDSANAFHERLISTRFDTGEIQIGRLEAGDTCFGYLYSFIFNGVVSNYQSGFVYETDPKLKPGLVGHTLAVEYNLAQKFRVYDFLFGDQRFKRSLATNEERMIWLVLRKDRLKFRIERALRTLLGHHR
jgi:CelD/BcsL family acetyltransferase involved in cellulose biosynthesis